MKKKVEYDWSKQWHGIAYSIGTVLLARVKLNKLYISITKDISFMAKT